MGAYLPPWYASEDRPFHSEKRHRDIYSTMTEYQAKTCLYCGKTFVPEHHREAYCSKECREKARKGQKQRYRDEHRPGSRRHAKAAPEAIADELGTVRQRDRKTQSAGLRAFRVQPGAEYLEEMLRDPGNTSKEYWEAFRGYELAQAAAFGRECKTVVNGLAVTDPGFVEAVLDSIEQVGHITITSIK